MSPLNVRSKVCIAPFHVRSKVYKFAPHMNGSNAHFAPRIDGSNADSARHMERRHNFRDIIKAEFAILANFQKIFLLSHLCFRSLYDLRDHFG